MKGKACNHGINIFPMLLSMALTSTSRLKGIVISFIKAIQSNVKQLQLLSNKIGKAFAVIDDGSHIPEHQLLTFNCFFDIVLQPGGIYILEDIEVSYWRRGSLYGY